MRVMIIGFGTIGITYGWMLSRVHEVYFYSRGDHARVGSIEIAYLDLRKNSKGEEKLTNYSPSFRESVDNSYDIILVCVNSVGLASVLRLLSDTAIVSPLVIFMMNHWKIVEEIKESQPQYRWRLSFPASVGGGRNEGKVECILFDEATKIDSLKQKLGESDIVRELFESAEIKTEEVENLSEWMTVHSIQQSVGIGAFVETGSFEAFRKDRRAIDRLYGGYKEALRVCESKGINPRKFAPWGMFYWMPRVLVTALMRNMFANKITERMIVSHKKHGEKEWIDGLRCIVSSARLNGVPVETLNQYLRAIEEYEKTRSV